jgi:two-component system chemotaxis response regulator CheV
MQDNKGILLETGTNEFEIVEFTVGGVTYGINVAKVREVINPVPVTFMANAHPYIDGVFSLRGNTMPLLNLSVCLGVEDNARDHKIIVSELNNCYVGFKVDEVTRIHRVSWTEMEPAPNVVGSELVTGIIKMKDKLIILLDFEKIVAEVNPEINKKLSDIPANSKIQKEDRGGKRLLIAEDSKMLRDMLTTTLQTAGYTNLTVAENGKEAWDRIEKFLEKEPAEDPLQLIITDIEMPQMDGHHLIKKIREQDQLKSLPVVIFSSLINEEMRRKGESIGANAQVAKPEISELIGIVDQLLGIG